MPFEHKDMASPASSTVFWLCGVFPGFQENQTRDKSLQVYNTHITPTQSTNHLHRTNLTWSVVQHNAACCRSYYLHDTYWADNTCRLSSVCFLASDESETLQFSFLKGLFHTSLQYSSWSSKYHRNSLRPKSSSHKHTTRNTVNSMAIIPTANTLYIPLHLQADRKSPSPPPLIARAYISGPNSFQCSTYTGPQWFPPVRNKGEHSSSHSHNRQRWMRYGGGFWIHAYAKLRAMTWRLGLRSGAQTSTHRGQYAGRHSELFTTLAYSGPAACDNIVMDKLKDNSPPLATGVGKIVTGNDPGWAATGKRPSTFIACARLHANAGA